MYKTQNKQNNQIIYLDKSHESWIKISYLDKKIIELSNKNFDDMTNLVKTDKKSRVMDEILYTYRIHNIPQNYIN